MGPQSLGKGTGRVRNQRKNQDHPDYSIVEIGQKTFLGCGWVLVVTVICYVIDAFIYEELKDSN